MKNCKGITLMTLIMYVGVLFIVIAIMSSIISNFYQNNAAVDKHTKDILEFNKFNSYFLKEIKKAGNDVENTVKNNTDNSYVNYILFKTGNSFSLKNNIIYYNNIKVCEGVGDLSFEYDSAKKTIKTIVNFKNGFSKTITYKIEEIYWNIGGKLWM